MKKKTAFAVFTTTKFSGQEYMAKGNFGDNEEKAKQWSLDNITCKLENGADKYPNGLFIKKVEY
jgi:hypothetical protein